MFLSPQEVYAVTQNMQPRLQIIARQLQLRRKSQENTIAPDKEVRGQAKIMQDVKTTCRGFKRR